MAFKCHKKFAIVPPAAIISFKHAKFLCSSRMRVKKRLFIYCRQAVCVCNESARI